MNIDGGLISDSFCVREQSLLAERLCHENLAEPAIRVL